MVDGKEAQASAPTSTQPTEKQSPFAAFAKGVWDLICEHWFILGLAFAIGFAAAVPNFGRKGGWIAAQWTIKYGAVIIIFFLSGCSLKTRALVTVLGRLHLHVFIQFICLVLTPAIGYGIARALMESRMNPDLVNGLVVAMVMPTTISTNVVFTKQAGGNEAAALVNAVIGNIIGIFVSPGWLYVYLGKTGQAPYGDVIKQLAITIIAPLIVGQLVQYFLPAYVKAAQDRVNFGKIGNLMIILLVWSTFCDTFHKNIKLGAGSWVPMLFLEIGLFLCFCTICLALGTLAPIKRLFNLDKPDAIAILMCGSTKTLALGMPLISVLYGKKANAGVLSLPLIIYHASQCLLGSIMIKRLKAWVDGPSLGAWPAACWPGHEAVGSDSKESTGDGGSVEGTAAPKGPVGKAGALDGQLGKGEVVAPVAADSPNGAVGLVGHQEQDVEKGEARVLVPDDDSSTNGRTAVAAAIRRRAA